MLRASSRLAMSSIRRSPFANIALERSRLSHASILEVDCRSRTHNGSIHSRWTVRGKPSGQASRTTQRKRTLADGRVKRGVIRLGVGESCDLDLAKTSIKSGFSGGLGIAVAPDISHTLMKVELRIPEWGAHAFTHFRPGLRSARLYQKPTERGVWEATTLSREQSSNSPGEHRSATS